MSSKRGVRRRQCGDKRKFETQIEADRHRRAMMRERLDRVSTYRCRWCGSWHIGHTPKGRIVAAQVARDRRGD